MEKVVLELPASVAEITTWLNELPPEATVEASSFSSFRKATGRTKVQRLVVELVAPNGAG